MVEFISEDKKPELKNLSLLEKFVNENIEAIKSF